MRGGTHGIAHVVQGVEDAHEVVALAGEVLGAGDLEAHAVADPRALGGASRRLHRRGVVVEADELRARVGLGHHDRRGAVSAADVGDARTGQQLLLDTLERGQPRRHEVRDVAGPEEQLGSAEQVAVVLVPPEAFARPEALGDLGLVAHARRGDVEGAGKERRALGIGEAGRLLRRQEEALAVGVVLGVAAGGLRAQPLAHVALVGARPRGELARRDRLAVAHRGVEAELVADEDGRLVQRCAEVAGEAPDELLQSPFVEGGVTDGHGRLLKSGWPGRTAGASARTVNRPSTQRQCAARSPTCCVGSRRCWSSACSAGSRSPTTTSTVAAPRGRCAALLAWLALHPGMQPRGRVAARLWPDVMDESARRSLRTALLDLRAALGPARGRAPARDA